MGHQNPQQQHMGQQQPHGSAFNNALLLAQQQQAMASNALNSQGLFGQNQYGSGMRDLPRAVSPKYKAFEFSKPSFREVEAGEKPSWSMVNSADPIEISSSEISQRIKKRRANSKKSVLDEYSDLPDSTMRMLVKKLVDDLNYKEGFNSWFTWSMELIETEKREYVWNRQRVRDLCTMRVYVKQSTKTELKDMARMNLQRSSSLSGTIDLSGPRSPVGFQNGQMPHMSVNNMGSPGINMPGVNVPGMNLQGGNLPGGNMQFNGGAPGMGNMGIPAMHGGQGGHNQGHLGGHHQGQPGAAINVPPPPGAGAGNNPFGAAGKAGKPPGATGNNATPAANKIEIINNNGGGKKKKSGSKSPTRSRSKSVKGAKGSRSRGRSGRGSDSDLNSHSDSDSDSSSLSDPKLTDRMKDMQQQMRRMSKTVQRMDLGRRASTSSRLPHAPMGTDRRMSGKLDLARHASMDRRRTSPVNIPRRNNKTLERSHHAYDSWRDRNDGYGSSGREDSWYGGGSVFSKESSEYTPPSSYEGRKNFGNPFDAAYREHRKPGTYAGLDTPPISPGDSDFEDRHHSRRHSGKYLPDARTDSNDYFGVPNRRSSSTHRVDDYRRKSEAAQDHIRARKQREQLDQRERYMRDERNRRAATGRY